MVAAPTDVAQVTLGLVALRRAERRHRERALHLLRRTCALTAVQPDGVARGGSQHQGCSSGRSEYILNHVHTGRDDGVGQTLRNMIVEEREHGALDV